MQDINCEMFDTVISTSMLGLMTQNSGIDIEAMMLPFGAKLCLMRRDYVRALRMYERFQGSAKRNKRPVSEAMVLNKIGAMYLAQGQYDEASTAFQNAYTLFDMKSYAEGQSVTLRNIGLAQTYQGHLQEARENYQAGSEFLKQQENTLWLATAIQISQTADFNSVLYTSPKVKTLTRCVPPTLLSVDRISGVCLSVVSLHLRG